MLRLHAPVTACVMTFLLGGVLGFSSSAHAQSMEEALQMYQNNAYDEAAFALYDILRNDVDANARDQAEIYLAESLRKMELFVPALFYYSDIVKAGPSNRYYLNAIDGLLGIQEALHDPLFVPELINQNLNPEAFAQLAPHRIAQVNYLVGALAFRKGQLDDARAFLEYVARDSRFYPMARYTLGLLAEREGKPEQAIEHFDAVISTIAADTDDEEQQDVRALAQLGGARVTYGLGRFADASRYYESVSHKSDHWFTALYENAWSLFRQEQYGKTLGTLTSVGSPYFAGYPIPEAYVIEGTTYFANCQWDRVRRSVQQYKATYEPMHAALGRYLAAKQEEGQYYRDILRGGFGDLSWEMVRQVRRTKRFVDYHFMLTHMAWERAEIGRTGVWNSSRLADDLTTILTEQYQQFETAVGSWVHAQIKNTHAQLTNFGNQITILDFEVADAERQWLEQGREILKGRRARLPRPEIPNDQWQHWNFGKEYWKDELGYYQHSLRTECQ